MYKFTVYLLFSLYIISSCSLGYKLGSRLTKHTVPASLFIILLAYRNTNLRRGAPVSRSDQNWVAISKNRHDFSRLPPPQIPFLYCSGSLATAISSTLYWPCTVEDKTWCHFSITIFIFNCTLDQYKVKDMEVTRELNPLLVNSLVGQTTDRTSNEFLHTVNIVTWKYNSWAHNCSITN